MVALRAILSCVLVAAGLDGQGPPVLLDIRPGAAGSSPNLQFDSNGRDYFSADDGTHGYELWLTDGTAAGTRLVADVAAGAASSSPYVLGAVGANVLFEADDGVHGLELWRTDGTARGTSLVKDIRPGPGGALTTAASGATAVFHGELYFAADDGSGAQLWKSDGTARGTVAVGPVTPGRSVTRISWMFALRDRLVYFAGPQIELFSTDGTANSTRLVTARVRFGGSPHFVWPGVFRGEVYFSGAGTAMPSLGWELWKSDGSDRGTVLVRDIVRGSGGSFPGPFVARSDALFFAAGPNVDRRLWRSDGTAAGTVLVSPNGLDPRYLVDVGGTLLYSAHDPNHGRELWRSDGTLAGTRLVADIRPGIEGSNPGDGKVGWPTEFIAAGSRRAWFIATNPFVGNELWVSDGTATGTRLAADLVPGPGNGLPTFVTLAGGRILFAGDSASSGRELWVVDPGATAQSTGAGCSHRTAVPSLTMSDPVLGGAALLRGFDAPLPSAAVLVLGPRPASNAYLGASCYLYVNLPLSVVLGVVLPTGPSWSLPVFVPPSSSLTGVRAVLQAVYVAPVGLEFSNAVVLTLGS